MFSLGSNPGHKVTKKGSNHSTKWADPYLRLSYRRISLFATIWINKDFYTCTDQNQDAKTYWISKPGREDLLTFCDFWPVIPGISRQSTSDGHPIPDLVLFLYMFWLIGFRRVWCFCVSRWVARLMRPGPRPDWSRPKQIVSKLTCLYQVRVFSNLYKQVVVFNDTSFTVLWHLCAVLTPGTRDVQAAISLEGDCQF